MNWFEHSPQDTTRPGWNQQLVPGAMTVVHFWTGAACTGEREAPQATRVRTAMAASSLDMLG